jgi:TolB-like protein
VGFFSNLRDRRLVQIVAAYAAAGWIALQGTDQLVNNGLAAPFVYGIVLAWYIVGFLAAIVIGWFHGERGAQKAPVSEIVILSALGLLLLGTTGMQVRGHYSERAARDAAAASELDLRRVAVSYFRDVRDGENQHIADALTEDLIGELARVRALDVISRNGVEQFRLTGATVDSIARSLRAGTIVAGDVEPLGDSIRVNIRLHDGQSGAEFRRTTMVRPASDLLAARQALAEQTARFLREWLGEEIQLRRRETDTDNIAAWALVQRAEKLRKDAERLLQHGAEHDGFAAFDQADQLLAQAETVDPRWAEPIVLRAHIEYRRSRIVHDPHDAEAPIRRGIAHAERALRLAPNHAVALELRGTLRYWWHLLPLVGDPAEHQQLLVLARRDLESAIRQDPGLASAHSTLSHLYARAHELSSSVLAAQRAYEEDAYLATADVVLWRLISGLYDQESFTQSRRWCDVGRERFPRDYRFVQCQLLLMTTRAVNADIDRAWQLLALADSLAPEPERAAQHARSLVFVGGVIGRAGLRDSADAVLRRARDRFRPELDPHRDIYLNEAGMRAVVLGDVEAAIDLLKVYAAANPGFDLSGSWWWRDVRRHPRYAELAVFERPHH